MKNLLTLTVLALLLVLTVGGGVQADFELNPETGSESDDHPWGGDECDEDVLDVTRWRSTGGSETPTSQAIDVLIKFLFGWSPFDDDSCYHSNYSVSHPRTGSTQRNLQSVESSTLTRQEAQK